MSLKKDTTWSFNPGLVHYRVIVPIYGYHKAMKGTVERFKGAMRRLFPELPKMTDEDLEEK